MIQTVDEIRANAEMGDTFGGVVGREYRWSAVTEFCQKGEGHFFDDDTMRFFNSELHGTPKLGVDGYLYAVVSSKGPSGPRTYQVVRITSQGNTHRPHARRTGAPDPRVFQFTERRRALEAQIDFVGGEQVGNWNWY